MCGLFAFAGHKDLNKDQIKNAISKMKILGIYNETRGSHSCGLYIGNEIYKGVDKLKLFSNFIENNVFEFDSTNHIMIGHTRQASRGEQNLENTHPFLIDNEMVSAHNGTIENIWELCDRYKIEHKAPNRISSDSKALFTIIHRTKSLKVLDEYKGNAALIWTSNLEENFLYIYHGSSRKSRYNEKEEEERPLFLMKTEEGIYISSLQDALYAIREHEEELPEQVSHNRVLKIKNGTFTNYRQKVNRGECNLPAIVITNNNYNKNKHDYYGHHGTGWQKDKSILSLPPAKIITTLEPLVWREKTPNIKDRTDGKNYIYFQKGRYYTTINNLPCQELIYIKKGGEIITKDDNPQVTEKYYFHDGVMMKGEKAYDQLIEAISKKEILPRSTTLNYALALSKYSMYPVTHRMAEAPNLDPQYRFLWYTNGTVAKDSFTPKFGGRNYIIKEGILTEIKPSNNKDKDFMYENAAQMTSILLEKKSINQQGSEDEIKVSQINLPFPEKESLVSSNEIRFDPILDNVFTSKQSLLGVMTSAHFNALKKYIKEEIILESSSDIPVLDDEIMTKYDVYLTTAVTTGKTLRMVLCDLKDDGSLDLLIKLEKNNSQDNYTSFEEIPFDMNNEEADKSIAQILESEEADDAQREFEEEQKQDAEFKAFEQVEDALDDLGDIANRARELEISESNIGKDMGYEINRSIENLKYRLAEVADLFGSKTLVKKINNTL